MTDVKSNLTFNTSSGSSHVDGNEDLGTIKVKNSVKDLLKSRIFLGRYLERRLADQRIGYRDVVLLSAAEVDLKRDLIEVQNRLRFGYSSVYWIGITDAEPLGYQSGICLWTEIDHQPFGVFWFQIKNIKFREEEIIISLKCIRHITDAFLEVEPILTGSGRKSTAISDKKPISTEAVEDTCQEIVTTLKGALSVRNVKEFTTFLFAFVIAMFTGSSAFINFLGNFVLALIREMSVFVKNSTPMFLGFLDFLSKIVGGFYILLAMFFRPSNPAPRDMRTITYNQHRSRSNNQYNDIDNSFD